ncbi:MAG: hypothetical protein Q4E01_04555 [Actinomycetaceae bacterium]|nr:hypothetical protein [Actinomycetaceae bacterium]
MSFTGWIIVALAIVVAVYWTPALIKNRNEVIESPVEDRFSCDLKLVSLAKEQPGFTVCGESGRNQPRILPRVAVCRVEPNLGSGDVQSVEADVLGGLSMAESKRTAFAGNISETSRDMAKLRASRAARLASENAAGKRRFAFAAAALTLLVAFVVAALVSSFAWGWSLIPLAALAGTLVEGRFAYRRSVRAAGVEANQMALLRGLRRREQERYDRVRASVHERIAAVEPATPEVSEVVEEESSSSAESASSSGEWMPQPVPKSLFARSEERAPRRVVADPVVVGEEEREAPVRVRPVVVKPMPVDALSSEEAAAEAPAAFDLENVLEFRRAQ